MKPLDSQVLRWSSNIRVLLAEDNLINQRVTRAALEHLGLSVDVVCNGREAVQAWQAQRYALVLMDCQMAELDGLAAARKIRRLEARGRRTPIIALTAHATAEAVAASRAAGMDDHLSKPLDRAKLGRCLEQWLGSVRAVNEQPGRDRVSTDAIVDWDALVDELRNESTARELAALFPATSRALLEKIIAADHRRDPEQVARQAHALHGAASQIYAHRVWALAQRLEASARADERCVSNLIQQLRCEVNSTIDHVHAILDEPRPGDPNVA